MEPKANIFYTLRDLKIEFVQEHRFDLVRGFLFDFAIPEHKIAIEYEGVKITRKEQAKGKKSRHTTVKGYSEDTVKYNLAVLRGWRVLRYTSLTYTNLRKELTELLCPIPINLSGPSQHSS